MSRFLLFRVGVLSVIAIGLVCALFTQVFERGSAPSLGRLWSSVWESPQSGSVVALAPDEDGVAPDRGHVRGRQTPRTPRSGGLLIDGGDFKGPLDTPTPVAAPTTPPSRIGLNDGGDNRGAKEGGGELRVTLPTRSTPANAGQEQFMVGGWQRGAAAVPTLVDGTPTPSESDWVGGQARGYAMLYALQPEARPVVEGHVSALLAARIREPYIGVLIDGTFGKDFGYLRELIKRLNTQGRNLHLALYLANGPAQRRYRNPPYEVPFVRLSPEEFRREIRRSNSDSQIQYLNIIADARRLFEYNILSNPDAKNYAVVMLEDNLESDSFRAMSNIAREQLSAVATIVRNPCKGCYAGNDDESLGLPLEVHQAQQVQNLGASDAVTLDGQGFLYPSEVARGKAITPEELFTVIKDSFQRRLSYFGLWRDSWQGVAESVPLTDPKTRTDTPSTPDELAFEIQVLREGLRAVNSEDL